MIGSLRQKKSFLHCLTMIGISNILTRKQMNILYNWNNFANIFPSLTFSHLLIIDEYLRNSYSNFSWDLNPIVTHWHFLKQRKSNHQSKQITNKAATHTIMLNLLLWLESKCFKKENIYLWKRNSPTHWWNTWNLTLIKHSNRLIRLK